MYQIVKKTELNKTVIFMSLYAPRVAKKAEAGQFIILRVDEQGERIPLTIAGYDREKGTVDIIFQVVGATTEKLNHKNEGESIADFVGPLGRKTEMENLTEAVIVGGGVGCAIALPLARALSEKGVKVHSIIGFRSKDLIILEDEFKKYSDTLTIVTDDGSYGRKALVTEPLNEILAENKNIQEVFAIGPLVMMKFVAKTSKPYNVKCTVSMNPIMIDGTGMCGGCRLSVGGKTKFACVDGPDFDGYLVDFDEAMMRSGMYKDFEKHAYESTCNLFKGAEK